MTYILSIILGMLTSANVIWVVEYTVENTYDRAIAVILLGCLVLLSIYHIFWGIIR